MAQQGSDSLDVQREFFISQGITLLQQPSTTAFLPASRQSHNPDNKIALISRDLLFRYLLNNERAIPRLIGFFKDPFQDITPASAQFPDVPFIVKSITLALDVHEDVHGFNATVNGGIICALMDEAMGTLLTQNKVLNEQAKAKGYIPAASPAIMPAATASMNVKYLRPLPTPKILLVTASLIRVEGRSMSMRVIVADKDGKEYASGNGSFITFSRAKI
ncbi:Thioesterase/thiol ester dehydrase-isomerase [Xylaria sp. FL0064]|nr:Thioesterase/thiol ester dehydrase-isomerase [Xylaria sp. FL0064]